MSLVLLGIAVVAWPVVQRLAHGRSSESSSSRVRDFWTRLTPTLTIASLAIGAVWATPALLRVYHWIHEHGALPFDWSALRGRMDAVLGAVGLGVSSILGALSALLKKHRKRFIQPMIQLAFLLSGPALYLLVYLAVSWRLILGDQVGESWQWGWVFAAALALVVWGWLMLNINTYSPHVYYRDRLCECFLATRGQGHASFWDRSLLWLQGIWAGASFDPRADDPLSKDASHQPVATLNRLPFSDLEDAGTAPLHLIGTTVNLTTSDDPNLRGRNGDFYTVSRLHSGSPICGYVKTSVLEQRDPHFDLGTATAISGAAASSNMGWKTLNNLRLLMTLTNVRLGYWMSNPLRPPSSPGFRAPGPWYLFKEMFGVMSEKAGYLNLSDGGHLENLGVYELLRRRCKFIVCVDSGDEPDMKCADLMRLQRYAEIDLEIRLEIDRSDFEIETGGLARSHAILVKIDYDPDRSADSSAAKAPLGWMLYFKLAMTGTEPEYVKEYRRENPSFPHQTTVDQVYDEGQFEAYRALGECAMEGALRDEMLDVLGGKKGATGSNLTIPDWFKALASNLLPDDDPVFPSKR